MGLFGRRKRAELHIDPMAWGRGPAPAGSGMGQAAAMVAAMVALGFGIYLMWRGFP